MQGWNGQPWIMIGRVRKYHALCMVKHRKLRRILLLKVIDLFKKKFDAVFVFVIGMSGNYAWNGTSLVPLHFPLRVIIFR